MAQVVIPLIIKDDGTAVLGKIEKGLVNVQGAADAAKGALGNVGNSLSSRLGPGADILSALGPAGTAAAVGLGAVVAAGAAAAAAMATVAKETYAAVVAAGSYAEKTLNLSAQTGLTAQEVQQLSKAMEVAGGDFGTAAGTINKMQKALAEGDDVFARLGLSATRLRGELPSQALAEVVERIQAIENPTLRSAAAMEALGKTGAEELPKLASALAAMGQFGGLDDDTLARAAAMDDALGKLGIAWKDLILEFGAAVGSTPELQEAVASITAVLKSVGDWITKNQGSIIVVTADAVAMGKALADGFLVAAAWAEKLLPILVKVADAAERVVSASTATGKSAAERAAHAENARIAAAFVGPLPGPEMSFVGPVAPRAATKFVPKGDADAAKAAAEAQKKAVAEMARIYEQAKKSMDSYLASQEKLANDKATAQLKATLDIIHLLGPTAAETAQDFDDLQRALFLTGGAAGTSTPQLQQYVAQLQKMIAAGQGGAKAQRDLENALDELSNRGVATIGDFPQEIAKAQTATEKWGGALSDAQVVMGGIAQIMDAFGVSSDSAAGKVLKLAQGLAGAGEKFLSGDVVGGIAQAAGSIASAVAGMFGRDWAKAARNASKQLGTDISEDLAKAIDKTAKEKHISTGAATMLHLTDAMAESGKDARSFAPQVQNLLRDIKSGAIPAKEGLEQVAGAFSSIRAAAQAAGTVGDKAMVSIIQQARASGQVVPEITAAVKESLGQAVSGVGALTKGIPIVSAEDATAQAYILSATFWGKVKEDGLIQAGTALQPAFQQMQESMSKAGIDPSVVASILGPIQGVMSLLSNDTTKGIAEGIGGLQDALKGLADSGYMTQGAFQGIQQQASSAFSQLTASGVDSTTALQAIAPLLGQLQSASQQYGLQLDANTQSLITQANQAGISFPTDPMQKVVDLLSSIATALGAEIPASAQVTANAMSSTASSTASNLSQMSNSTTKATDLMLSAVNQTIAAGGENMVATWTDKTQAMQGIFGDSASTIAELAGMSADQVSGTFDSMGSNMKATFESVIDTSTDKMAALAETTLGVVDGLSGMTDAATLAGMAMQGIRFGEGGPGFTMEVPHFAGGGLVSRRTFAQIGEAGPEAVTPLEQVYGRMGDIVAGKVAGALGALPTGGGGDIVIPIDVYLDGDKIFGQLLRRSKDGTARFHINGLVRNS